MRSNQLAWGGEGGCSVLDPLYSLLLVAALASTVCAQDTAPTAPAPVAVTTRVEPKSVTIGTPFRYVMRVEGAGDVELIVPVVTGKLGGFLITDFGEVPQHDEGGRLVLERWYTLLGYEVGDQIVPGPPIHYRVPGSDMESIEAPDVLVTVQSLLGDTEDGLPADDVRDIKGPMAVPRDYRPLVWALAALLLLVGIGWALYWLFNRPRQLPIVPPRPAHELALDALARLRAARLLDAGRHMEYYVRLSAVVRHYLEGRFGLRAPEMTTEEFLQAVQRGSQLPVAHRSLLAEFLCEADLVKFARHMPTVDDADRAFGAARQFVESTIPRSEDDRAAA